MKAGKVWGETELLLRTPLLEVHRIRVYPRARSSRHRHRARWNVFIVTAGRLFVDVNNGPLTDATELGPGEIMTVAPGLWHRFRTEGAPECYAAEALELYYPDALSAEDIERSDTGRRDGS